MNFNEFFRKNVAYDNLKSHDKIELYPFSFLEKPCGISIDPLLPAFLVLMAFSCYLLMQNYSSLMFAGVSATPLLALIESSKAWKVSVFEVFLICTFLHPDWIRRDTPCLSVFSPNAGKYGSEKLQIRTLFRREFIKCKLSAHIKSIKCFLFPVLGGFWVILISFLVFLYFALTNSVSYIIVFNQNWLPKYLCI